MRMCVYGCLMVWKCLVIFGYSFWWMVLLNGFLLGEFIV